jgi:DNA-binding transcriptional regulator of glucitol operon
LNALSWISIGAVALLLQYGLTILQIRHYRSAMKELVDEYRGLDGFHLYSGISRKALGAGAIVLLIVDEQYQVRKCQLLSGYSVFSRFKPFLKYEGCHIGEVLAEAHETIGNRKNAGKKKSLAQAFHMASENAIKSLPSRKVANDYQ